MAMQDPKKTRPIVPLSDEAVKLLPAPKASQQSRTQNLLRLISALLFAILGFNFASSPFFDAYPLFGVTYLTQLLITPLTALAGYFVIFEALLYFRNWFERLITTTVVDVVSSFWDMQSRRIQEQRRIKQKAKSDIEHAKLEEALKNAVVLDTSVLIDGRILDIVKQGFLDASLIVAQEVIDELHLLSDNKETLKRQKGRRGLDVLKELKKYSDLHIKTVKAANKQNSGVDSLILGFCKDHKVKMATLDFNLNKVANVAGVKVLNINSLANSLKTVMLPGEEITTKIIHEGKEKQQGIGYLEDGTMLVIEGAKDMVGTEVKAVVAKVIQSHAGRMIFCKLYKD